MADAIITEKLTKRYNGLTALDNLDLRVPEGTVFGFLGPNGAGKTTTLKILTSLIKPTSGRAYLFGNDVISDSPRALLDAGAVVEMPEFYPYLSPDETLEYFGRLRGMKGQDIRENASKYLAMVGLEGWRKKRIGTFSRGMKQRLAIAQALLHDPRILLLDEPSNGLDPRGMVEVREVLRGLRREGKTIFMSSHLLGEVQEVCDSVSLIDKGRLLLSDSVENLSKKSGTVDVELKLLEPAPPEQLGLLSKMEGVESVSQTTPTTILLKFAGDSERVVILLKRIVNQDMKIYSFRASVADLEGIYLKMIKESVR